MRKAIIFIFFISLLSLQGRGQEVFQHALVPDSIARLDARCNYLAEHYWDHCDMKSAMSHRTAMVNELETYLNIIINADNENAVRGLQSMLKRMEKQPDDVLFFTQQAEKLLYGDSAVTWVDELYIPFLEATTSNKKIAKEQKPRYAHELEVLKNSLVGQKLGNTPLILRDGSRASMDDYNAEVLVIFFYDPTCEDCHLARMRLNGDIATSNLIDKGKVKIVAVSLTDADDEWKNDATSWPDNWVVAAGEEADMTYDMRGGSPGYYILDRDHKLRYKNLTTDQVLDIMRQLNQR